jgi:hypothetical protein
MNILFHLPLLHAATMSTNYGFKDAPPTFYYKIELNILKIHQGQAT